MTALLLTAAILSEVTATLSLRVYATSRARRWIVVVAVGYLVAFTLLAVVLGRGVGVGVVYGIWSASGIALTAIASRVLFRDPLTSRMLAGIGLILVGVVLIEFGQAQ